jgi:uncharacterized membrane protein YedE/YeeE
VVHFTFNHGAVKAYGMKNIKFLLLGVIFGIILIKAEVVSWFRIQEMFRFQSFHMYGIICSAIAVGVVSVWLIKKFGVRTIKGDEITIAKKQFTKGNVFGGLIFGCGWGMVGACPGPLFALIGSGLLIVAVVLLSAIIGTYTYGVLRDRLPH